MKRVYISGPITGLSESEFRRRFESAEEIVRGFSFTNETYLPVSPLKIKACSTENCNNGVPRLGNGDYFHSHQCYMRHDLKALLDCDIIMLLPGWEKSRGAQLEMKVARAVGMEVLLLNMIGASDGPL